MAITVCLFPLVNRLLSKSIKLPVPQVQKMVFRGFAGRECSDQIYPICSPEALEKSDCMKKKNSEKKADKKAIEDIRTMEMIQRLVYNPDCCPPVCPDMPRFDDLYYKDSDKRNRMYQQTWADCRDPIVKKKVCIRPKKQQVVIQKRKARATAAELAKTACSKQGRDRRLMQCTVSKKVVNVACPKFVLPHCKKVRSPATCAKSRPPTDCKKRCTKYPSFSECIKPPFGKGRKVECDCLKIPSLCEIWRVFQKRHSQTRD